MATVNERQPLLQPDQINVQPESNDDATQASQTDMVYGSNGTKKAELTYKLPAVMLNFATTGLGQSAIGALIPDIEAHYKLKNGPTAFIFPAAITGYFVAVYLMERLHLRFGRRGLAFAGPVSRIIACGVIACGPPFPAALLGYLVFGFGTGFTDAGLCAWGSGVPFANIVQGIMHGSWSVGCVIGPLVAVRVVGRGWPWYAFYRILAVSCFLELIFLGLAFGRENAARYRQHKCGQDAKSTKYNPLRSKLAWLCALYWFFYVGIESSYGDWIVTYMGNVRNVDRHTAAGAASIFWTGMCIGRVILSPITEFCGLKRAVSAYIVIAFVVQATLKLITGTTTFLVVLAIIGAFFGPIFPSGIVLLGEKLPVEAHVQAVSTAAALGQSGGSIAPLVIGFLADAFGIGRLLDVVTVLTILLLGLWLIFCRSAD